MSALAWLTSRAMADMPTSYEARGRRGERYLVTHDRTKRAGHGTTGTKWSASVNGEVLDRGMATAREGREVCEEHAAGKRGAA